MVSLILGFGQDAHVLHAGPTPQVNIVLQCVEFGLLDPLLCIVPGVLAYLLAMQGPVDDVLVDRDEVHLRAAELGMPSTAKLTGKHLKLIHYVLVLVLQKAVHLEVHLGLLYDAHQLLMVQEVYYGVH